MKRLLIVCGSIFIFQTIMTSSVTKLEDNDIAVVDHMFGGATMIDDPGYHVAMYGNITVYKKLIIVD